MKEKNGLPAHNTFENKRRIKALGAAKLKNGQVHEEALLLGERFLPQIQSAYMPKVSVRWISDAIGHGLFAECDLPEGAYVGEYTGHVRKNDQRYFQPLNNYCYEYPVPDELGRSYVIDATNGNLTRYINHSFTPNLRPVHAFANGFYHLIFLTLTAIPAGTQLCYDYGQNYWYVRDRPQPLE
jgi:SET domain-containing protein